MKGQMIFLFFKLNGPIVFYFYGLFFCSIAFTEKLIYLLKAEATGFNLKFQMSCFAAVQAELSMA